MLQWRVRHFPPRVEWLLSGLGRQAGRGPAAPSQLWCSRRKCAGHASQFVTEATLRSGTRGNRHHCLNSNQTTSAAAPNFTSMREAGKLSAPLLKPEAAETSTSSSAWDLRQLLFGLHDFRTGVVTYVEAEERLRGMQLLEEWMIQKLFVESGWVRQLQDSAETAPQYRGVVGEQKILRYMLHRFLSDETIWRDDLLSLLELLLGVVDQCTCCPPRRDASQHTAAQPGLMSGDNSVCGDNNDNILGVFPLSIPGSLLMGPEKMNFYSYGLQNILWDFLHLEASSFGGTSALWLAFVASHRNLLSLPSPQRPPFSRYECHPGLLGVEFVEAPHAAQPGKTMQDLSSVAGGAAPHEAEACRLQDDEQAAAASNDSEAGETATTPMTMDDERGKSYLRDRFYMNVIEPGEVSFPVSSTPPGALQASWRGERELLNPVNGEVEDVHLTHLWSIFQALRLEDSIDMYRAVRHGDLEKLQGEVFMDVLARKGLLMLFFARDEVRAVTPPPTTFHRLRRLHQELGALVSWPSTHNYRVPPPPAAPSFDQLALPSQLSFSCFAQLHAPVQRDLYRCATPSASPAQLYDRYRESYLRFAVQPAAHLKEGHNEDAGKPLLGESSAVLGQCKFPAFECLSQLQQMAFQYPFQDAAPYSAPQQSIDGNCTNDEILGNAAIQQYNTTELILPELSEESLPPVRRRGRPRKAAPAEPEALEESTSAAGQREEWAGSEEPAEPESPAETLSPVRRRGRPRKAAPAEPEALGGVHLCRPGSAKSGRVPR
ncbi:uncharacterized protein Tco025E_05273, partial [Trypanosoma conorhini]